MAEEPRGVAAGSWVGRLSDVYGRALEVDAPSLKRGIRAIWGRPLLVIGPSTRDARALLAARLHTACTGALAASLPARRLGDHPRGEETAVLVLPSAAADPAAVRAVREALREISAVVVLVHRSARGGAGGGWKEHAPTYVLPVPVGSRQLRAGGRMWTAVLLARAYLEQVFASEGSLPASLPSLRRARAPWVGRLAAAASADRLLVLTDPWSSVAAGELASLRDRAGRAETSLRCVGEHDPRRDRRDPRTGSGRRVLSLRCSGRPAGDRRGEVPRPDLEIHTSLEGSAGALDLLGRVLRSSPAEVARRGPGNREGDNAGVSAPRRSGRGGAGAGDPEGRRELAWLRRKLTDAVLRGADEADVAVWSRASRRWRRTIERARFGGVVLDYDGTLCEPEARRGAPARLVAAEVGRLMKAGALIGVATGRGRSAVRRLRILLPRWSWADLRLGLYNAGVVMRLAEPPPEVPEDPALRSARARLSASPLLTRISRIDARPLQLTLDPVRPMAPGFLHRAVVESLAGTGSHRCADLRGRLRVHAASFSVDVLPRWVSKRRLVRMVRSEVAGAGRGENVLAVGDRGRAHGNDLSLVAGPYGLSVDEASSSLLGCWNVAPVGERHTVALLRYLRALRPASRGGLRFDVDRASGGPR